MKGFYFSFDALLALMVMSASLAVVSQSSDITTDVFNSKAVGYKRASLIGQDTMKSASKQTMRDLNKTFQSELVDKTIMTKTDLNSSILDGVSLLWAARNFTYAEKTVKRYFGSKIPDNYDYRLQVNEDGSKTVIYQTSTISKKASYVSSISRLVSGHKIDKPSEGFQARARAIESKTNQTKVVNIPMMGSGALNQRLFLNKRFQLNASKIHSATLYFSAQWGESNFKSNTVSINGKELDIGGKDQSDWLYYAEKNSTTLGFDKVDVTSAIQKNDWNRFYLEFKNQNNHHVHIHPGTRIRIRYSSKGELNTEDGKQYLADIESETSNKNKRGGAWITKPIHIPENSTVNNVSVHLELRNLQDITGRPDLLVYLNKQKVFSKNVSGDTNANIQLKEEVKEGTNVLSVYGNVKLFEGRINSSSFLAYKNGNPRIYSNPKKSPKDSSYIYKNVDSPYSGLKYGKLRIIDSKTVGGIAENPKEFTKTFKDDFKVQDVYVNLAQLDSRNISIEAGSDSLRKVFTSPRDYATPTKIRIDPSNLKQSDENEFRILDRCRINCSILPQTSLETHIMIPSQVGYGNLFENKSLAVKDAKERLKNLLGDYADATSIESDTVSTGNQPYLWGPASIRLVIWNE